MIQAGNPFSHITG